MTFSNPKKLPNKNPKITENTAIVAAVLVGFIARSIGKHLSFLPVLIYGDDKEEEEKIEEELKDVVE